MNPFDPATLTRLARPLRHVGLPDTAENRAAYLEAYLGLLPVELRAGPPGQLLPGVADLLAAFIHTFRMPVFFILAGFFVALLLQSRGPAGLAAHRLRRLGLPFVDSDSEIEDASGLSAAEVFEKFGEKDFRDGERRVIGIENGHELRLAVRERVIEIARLRMAARSFDVDGPVARGEVGHFLAMTVVEHINLLVRVSHGGGGHERVL